jgi:hypothetical protein
MKMETIKEVLMERDSMTAEAAEDLIAEAQAEFDSFIDEGNIEGAEQICSDWFGLEPDYLIELF